MGCQRKNAALPEQARACFVAHRYASEAASINVWYSVVSGEPLIYEGIVGGQQLRGPPVFAIVLGAQQAPQLIVEPGRAGFVARARPHCILMVHVFSIGTGIDFFEADL